MINILFLEDEETILDVTTEYMKMQNYNVVCARNGREAIRLLQEKTFELAILDIMVPEVSGLEVLEYIKSNKLDMATIMLTALSDEKTQVKAFNLNADDYIIKPFSPLLLLKRIEAIIRRTYTRDNSKFNISNLWINNIYSSIL